MRRVHIAAAWWCGGVDFASARAHSPGYGGVASEPTSKVDMLYYKKILSGIYLPSVLY
jgi:hypothetical protein